MWFASRSLSETECLTCNNKKKKNILVVAFAVKKFHYYVFGHDNINIFTDHQPVVSIISKCTDKVKNIRLEKLKLKLINYNFLFEYLPEKYMSNANLLTRNIIKKKMLRIN